MIHVSLLLPKGDTSISNLEATHKMFTMANSFLMEQGEEARFRVELVAASNEGRTSNGIFTVSPDRTIVEVERTDLIIIPAIHGDYEQVVKDNRAFIPWIKEQYEKGAEIASLCIGAFLLASTGLLNGKHCTTHWMASEEFKAMFPKVELLNEKIITDEKGIYTSGGAYSSLNLNLYLIEKLAGRKIAILQSKVFEIDIDRNSQSPFIIFSGQKGHNDQGILKAQEYIEGNYQDKITIEMLCNQLAIGRRTFERRFKKATGNTVVEYAQRVKMEVAKKQFEAGMPNVNEVMFHVGYSDSKAFREVFKKFAGMSPVDYRNKYRELKWVSPSNHATLR